MSVIAGNGQAGYNLDDGKVATEAVVSYPTDVVFDRSGNLYISDHYCHCVRKVSTQGIITTAVGIKAGGNGGNGGDGGPATSARLNEPSGLAFDSFGNLYIADRSNSRIRKVTTTGIISTFAFVPYPGFVAIDSADSLYVSSGVPTVIYKITSAGLVSTFAGGGSSDEGDGGPATSARIFASGLELDAQGNLYIVESHRIRKVTPAGIISTVAGSGVVGFTGDGGPAIAASVNTGAGGGYYPGIAVDPSGNLYFSDSGNDRVRKVTLAGTITTFAGGGANPGDGGLALTADLSQPQDVTLDSAGNLYIADTGNARVRKVTADGRISTLAGNGTYGFSGDGGPATAAAVAPWSIAVDSTGNLYVSDPSRVRHVSPSGIVRTVMTFPEPNPGNSSGNFGLATDASGNLYAAAGGYHRVFKVAPGGVVSTIAGDGSIGYSGDGGPAASAQMNNPSGVALDTSGNLYIAECGNHIIRKVSASGLISTVAGDGSIGQSGDGGPALSAKLGCPRDLAVDAVGNLYFSDNHFEILIRKVDPAGVISTVAGGGTQSISEGNLATGVKFGLSIPGMSLDPSGNLYVADSTNHRIRKITFIAPGAFLTTGLSPGSVTEGEPTFGLSVRGANFQTGDSIAWNGSPRSTTFVSSTELRVVILTSDVQNPGTVQVTVSRGSQLSNAFLFTVAANNAPPVIRQVLPGTGSVLGNTRLTILGDNFKPNLASASSPSTSLKQIEHQGATTEGVYLGGKKLSEVIFVNRKRLEATTMPSVAASVDVEVVQSTGSSRLSGAFAYTAFPPVPPVEGTAPNKRLFIPFAIDSEDFRTNLGINNLSDTTATVDILLVDSNGGLIAQMPATVPAHGMKQINHVMRELEKSGTTTGRQGYLILQSAQNIRGWASQVDNSSDDPGMELGRAESEAAGQLLVPSSVASSRFLTSLAVINSSDSPGNVTIRARGAEGNVLKAVSRSILGKGYLFFQDFYQSLGLSDVFGPIEVETAGSIRVLAAERIYSRESTSGYFEGVTPAIASRMTVLPYSVDTEEFRTNLGVNNPGDAAATVTVSLVDKVGLSLGSRTVSVPPHALTQLSDVNRQLLGSTTSTNREGTLWLEADRPIVAWTSQIDNLTQDPSLVVAKNNAASRLLIPSTTSAGSFKSSLAIVNLSSDSNVVQVIARDNEGNLRGSTMRTLPPRGLMTSEDILSSLGLAGTFGPLEIISIDNKPLQAVSRVYSAKRTGGYFEGLPIGAGSVP